MLIFFILARRLNEYIRHFEPLSYDTEQLHRNHLRAKRSTDLETSIVLKFRAHNRDFRLRLKRDVSAFSDDLVVVGPLGTPEDLDTSHIYRGHLLGEPKSHAFGSITNGIFHGKIVSPRDGAWFVEKAHYYFPPHEVNNSLHSVIYHEKDVLDPYAHKRDGDATGCGVNEKTLEWMERIQNSATPESRDPFKRSWDPETPQHKYSREANEQGYSRAKRATRPKEDNKNTCSLFIQTDPLIWRHIFEQVRM